MAKGDALLALLAPKGAISGKDDGPDDEKSESGDYAQAAQDFFEAAQKKDWDAAGEALETAMLNCMSGHKEGDKEE
jgi:hypothetical protein